MHTQTVYQFIIMLVVLGLVYLIAFPSNMLGQVKTLESTKPFLKITDMAASGTYEPVGTVSWDYHVSVAAKLKIKPVPASDIVVVPIINFKGVVYKDKSFTLQKDQDSYDYFSPQVEINSRIPPLFYRPEKGSMNFVEGQDVCFGPENGCAFKITLKSVSESIVQRAAKSSGYLPNALLNLVSTKCTAAFGVQCRDGSKEGGGSVELACDDNFNECASSLGDPNNPATLCGGSVFIAATHTSISCADRTASSITVVTENGKNWDTGDGVELRFLLKYDDCIDTHNKLSELDICTYPDEKNVQQNARISDVKIAYLSYTR